MSEVAVQNGSGQAAKLKELAARIKAEHRAYNTAIKAALGQLDAALWHALDAGDLLLQAKAEHKYGTWEDWLKANCKVSARRAQEYMFLARGRAELEEVKARGSAFSSIGQALEFLRMVSREASGARPEGQTVAPGPSVPGVFTSELPIEAKARRAKERAEQRLLRKAEDALRTGNLDPPGDLTNEEYKRWQGALIKAQTVREDNLPTLLDILGSQLNILSKNAPPEKVGRYLTGQRVGYEAEELRADILAELRAALPWLQRVLEEAEQEQRQNELG